MSAIIASTVDDNIAAEQPTQVVTTPTVASDQPSTPAASSSSSSLPPSASHYHSPPPSKRQRIDEQAIECDFILVHENKRAVVSSLVQDEKSRLSAFYKWSPSDDLLLKNAVEKYLGIEEIYEQVKFNSKFTRVEIAERWKALLYDKSIAEYVSRVTSYCNSNL